MKAICTPTRDQLYAGFTYDLVNLIKVSPETIFTITQGTLLANLRELLAKTCVENNITHLLFIDSDMRFPPDTMERLVKRDCDIIGANCKQRTQDEWTARKDGKFIDSFGKKGIEEVDTLGFGVTLIKTSVFKKMAEPWFSTPWDGTKHVGEDVYFCTMARIAGFKIMVDHDLSKEIKHAGLVEFGIK